MGGWVKAFSPRWAQKLATVLPEPLARRVIGLAEWHATMTSDRPETGKEIRKALELFEKQLGRFREQQREIPATASDLLHLAAYKIGDPELLSRCRDDLARLDTALGAAWQMANDAVKIGRRGSLEEAFAREVALGFREFGIEPDARPTGDFYFALGLAFDAIKEEHRINLRPADLSGLASRALERLEARKKESQKR